MASSNANSRTTLTRGSQRSAGMAVPFAAGLAASGSATALTVALVVLGISAALVFVIELLSLPAVAQHLGYRQLRWNTEHLPAGEHQRDLNQRTVDLARTTITGKNG
ncbi:hypothetical protein [Amycolatopsis sp. 195334CR]|uniref:hypothetical protein n=1 Tax=Amycolatopsis sp. 195334CR TaxID=2814588 RepID=UPI001A9040C6|nr:hypothetical protein [Amycolatopsis sp. 195334CR]MBN6038527.1 hypothetical protein [Amycolatopsis sp. 195334CR]